MLRQNHSWNFLIDTKDQIDLFNKTLQGFEQLKSINQNHKKHKKPFTDAHDFAMKVNLKWLLMLLVISEYVQLKP